MKRLTTKHSGPKRIILLFGLILICITAFTDASAKSDLDSLHDVKDSINDCEETVESLIDCLYILNGNAPTSTTISSPSHSTKTSSKPQPTTTSFSSQSTKSSSETQSTTTSSSSQSTKNSSDSQPTATPASQTGETPSTSQSASTSFSPQPSGASSESQSTTLSLNSPTTETVTDNPTSPTYEPVFSTDSTTDEDTDGLKYIQLQDKDEKYKICIQGNNWKELVEDELKNISDILELIKDDPLDEDNADELDRQSDILVNLTEYAYDNEDILMGCGWDSLISDSRTTLKDLQDTESFIDEEIDDTERIRVTTISLSTLGGVIGVAIIIALIVIGVRMNRKDDSNDESDTEVVINREEEGKTEPRDTEYVNFHERFQVSIPRVNPKGSSGSSPAQTSFSNPQAPGPSNQSPYSRY